MAVLTSFYLNYEKCKSKCPCLLPEAEVSRRQPPLAAGGCSPAVHIAAPGALYLPGPGAPEGLGGGTGSITGDMTDRYNLAIYQKWEFGPSYDFIYYVLNGCKGQMQKDAPFSPSHCCFQTMKRRKDYETSITAYFVYERR